MSADFYANKISKFAFELVQTLLSKINHLSLIYVNILGQIYDKHRPSSHFTMMGFNSLAHEKCGSVLASVLFKHILPIDVLRTSVQMVLG